ncbi:metallophosphoesterase family protein [Candidatus Parcubacteria bacterium]|nr:metallophosphoesterase family protein [Candidatus Parcubacteria bacterium]
MKVVIISDIHDNIVNLNNCLSWCKKNNIEELICCGDVTNIETIEAMAANFPGIIHLVRGNINLYEEKDIKKYANINNYGRLGFFKLDNYNIGFCHEPFLIEEVKKKGKCDYIFYGHTHKPWIEEKNKIRMVNPGTLGGMFQKGTFAVWETTKNIVELKILEKINLA